MEKKIALKSQVSQKLRRDEKENHRRKLAASRSARSKSKITEHRTSSVVANAWIYTNRELSEMTFFPDPDTPFSAEKETVTWIDIHGLHDEKFIADLAKQFNLHALVIEDILTTDQLPKIESYCDFNHIVIKNFGFKANTNLLIWEQVSFILGPDFVISIQEGNSDLFSHIKALLENPKSRVREKKADYLLYVLLDVVVDNGYLILDELGSKMEEVEDMLLTSMQPHSIQRIHALKKDLLTFRRYMWPVRGITDRLATAEDPMINPETVPYLNDIYDHLLHILDLIETFREVSTGIFEIYLATIQIKTNEVMKTLTMVATIFLPLTFLVGIYGMNFKFMPELGWVWGYPMVWGLSLLISVLIVWYYHKKHWS